MNALCSMRINELIVKITGAIHRGEAITMKIPGEFHCRNRKLYPEIYGSLGIPHNPQKFYFEWQKFIVSVNNMLITKTAICEKEKRDSILVFSFLSSLNPRLLPGVPAGFLGFRPSGFSQLEASSWPSLLLCLRTLQHLNTAHSWDA